MFCMQQPLISSPRVLSGRGEAVVSVLSSSHIYRVFTSEDGRPNAFSIGFLLLFNNHIFVSVLEAGRAILNVFF